MNAALNLRLTHNEARILKLALDLFRSDRAKARADAPYLSPESQPRFLRAMIQDAADARAISQRIDAALSIRRSFLCLVPEAPADIHPDLPDTPTADGLDTTDCTGVLKGNTDIVCERGEGRDP